MASFAQLFCWATDNLIKGRGDNTMVSVIGLPADIIPTTASGDEPLTSGGDGAVDKVFVGAAVAASMWVGIGEISMGASALLAAMRLVRPVAATLWAFGCGSYGLDDSVKHTDSSTDGSQPDIKADVDVSQLDGTKSNVTADVNISTDVSVWVSDDAVDTVSGKEVGEPLPEGSVCIDELCMDKTEVIELAYAAVMGKSPSSNGPQMPVTFVSEIDAEAYCKKIGKRLPTSVEWQKFAGPHKYATYDGKLLNEKGEKEANFDSNGPMNVKSFLPNNHGMHDMTGNVYELVTHEDLGVMVLGGSWMSAGNSVELHVVPNENVIFFSGVSSNYVGFRCVKDSKK